MADRFPSLDEFDAGQQTSIMVQVDMRKPLTFQPPGHTNVNDLAVSGDASSFLARERAMLGDDADMFTTPNDPKATTVEDDDDLLGGGGDQYHMHEAEAETLDFESSFPDIDSTNAVCCASRMVSHQSLTAV